MRSTLLFSRIIAIAISCFSITSLVSYAEAESGSLNGLSTTYDTRDVNRDGTVDATDMLYLQRRLQGIDYSFRNVTLDANCNSIVSIADHYDIDSCVYGKTYSCLVDGYTYSFTHGTSTVTPSSFYGTTSTYLKYNYSSGVQSSYSLTLDEPEWDPSGIAYPDASGTPGIIGTDTRYADDETDGVVYIDGVGTGFIVGKHTIATAAHCVYVRGATPTTGYWNTNVSHIYLTDSNGQADTSYSLTPVEAHIPYGFLNIPGYTYPSSEQYDYALITVEENLSSYPRFALGIPYNPYSFSAFGQYNIYTSGFSGTKPDGNPNSSHQLYTSYGNLVYRSDTINSVLFFDTDLTYGNSGGPVYVKETVTQSGTTHNINTAISICSDIYNYNTPHHNSGPCINAIMLKFYLNNINAIYY